MPGTIGLFEAIYSQRAIRSFKPDAVSDETVRSLIEAATKAPSGGNRQPWKFLVIRDADAKRRIGEYYWQAWEAAYGTQAATPPEIQPHVRASAAGLAENMADVPLLVLACVEHDGSPSAMGRGSSIYPAVQNLLLAARGLGLGSVITTLHKRYEAEIKQLLGIPENVETAALLPIGYPTDDVRYGPTRRAPVEEVTYWDRWGQGPPES
jgi:nitroreductase